MKRRLLGFSWGLLACLAPAVAQPPAVAVTPSAKHYFDLRWRVPLVRRHFYREIQRSLGQAAIVPAAHVVVVGTGAGDLFGLSLEDGNVLWQRHDGGAFAGAASVITVGETPAVQEQLVLIGNRNGTVLCVEPRSGALRYQVPLALDVQTAARQHGKTLWLLSSSNQLVALEARSGAVLWTATRPAAAHLSIEGQARPAYAEARVFATFSDGYAAAFDAEHGVQLWSRPLALRNGPFSDADADPQVAHGRLFVAAYSDGVYALNPQDGQTLWEHHAPGIVSLATYGDLIIAGSADGSVLGLRQRDGSLRYRVQLQEGPISRLHVEHAQLLLTAGHSGLVVLDAANGRPLQATPLHESVLGDPSVASNLVTLVTGSGHLLAFAPQKL